MPGLRDRVNAFLAPAEAKAAYGQGVAWMTNEPSLRSIAGSDQDKMRDAQIIAQSNRWVRAAERTISHAFGTVDWHLEDGEDEAITDESPDAYKAIQKLLEKPYTPLDGDPITATPRTRSGLWSLTSRHMGVCGSSFWYLDQTNALAGIPLQILYINPARMTPSGVGNRLVGWVLDKDNRGGGTPLEAKNVLHFTLEEPDDGFFPPGLVETAYNDVQITKAADRHTFGSFSSGGKLPGVFSPRGDNTMPPDVFQALEKELRAANEHPDAARRSIILRGPIDFTPTAATAEQMDVVGLLQNSRDDILGLWGVPLSQLGIATPAGLNSGSTKSYDEAALWQKAVHPRLVRFWEVLQFQLLDRFSALGFPVELELDEPQFDDDSPMYEIASKAINLPLTNAERRALVGLDPFGDPALDNAVVMPATMVDYGAVVAAKAKPLSVPTRRAVEQMRPKIEKAVAAFLAEQKAEIVALVRKNGSHIVAKPNETSAWWKPDEWDARLEKVLRPYAAAIANVTADHVSARMKPAGKAGFDDLVGNRVFQRLLKTVGVRIKGINETTRDKVQAAIKEGIEAGDGAAQLGDRVEAAAAFDEYRAELIARTESAQVLNASQLESYREYDVTRVVAIDGDDDEECSARDGQEFDLEEALSIQDHPNGTLDWSPVVGAA